MRSLLLALLLTGNPRDRSPSCVWEQSREVLADYIADVRSQCAGPPSTWNSTLARACRYVKRHPQRFHGALYCKDIGRNRNASRTADSALLMCLWREADVVLDVRAWVVGETCESVQPGTMRVGPRAANAAGSDVPYTWTEDLTKTGRKLVVTERRWCSSAHRPVFLPVTRA